MTVVVTFVATPVVAIEHDGSPATLPLGTLADSLTVVPSMLPVTLPPKPLADMVPVRFAPACWSTSDTGPGPPLESDMVPDHEPARFRTWPDDGVAGELPHAATTRQVSPEATRRVLMFNTVDRGARVKAS